jgi:predicted MFS family arabinose efflux permease
MKPSTSERVPLWSRSFLLTIAVNLLVLTAVSMLMTTLPLYAKSIGASNAMAGLVVTIYALASLACRPIVGAQLDSKGRKPLLVAGAVILLVSFLIYPFATSMTAILIVRIVQGAGFSAHSTTAGTIVADIVPGARLAEGIGYFGASITLPTAFGPSLGLLLIDRYGYNALFLVAALFTAAGLAIALTIRYEQIGKRDNNTLILQGRRALRFQIERAALLPGLVMFFLVLGLAGIVTFLPQAADERGIEGIGAYFTVYACALLSTRLFSGKLADRAGVNIVIYPGIVLVVLSFLLLAYSNALAPALLAALLFGLGFGSVQPAMNAIVIRNVKPERKGAASAVFTAAMDVGMAVGSAVWGLMSQGFGFTLVYLVCAACAFISLLVYQRYLARPAFRNDATCPTLAGGKDGGPFRTGGGQGMP